MTSPELTMNQTMMSGGEALICALGDAGVERLFGYPGGAALHIYDAIFKQQQVEHVLTRHEQAATHMADGYARATGKAGVVLVTSGPGATNAITGIATAYMDSIPMVVISGQVAHELIGTDAFQETDMIGLSRPVVKHSFLVMSAESIPEIVAKAFYIAQSGRPGPVVIDVPKDVTDPTVKCPYSYPKQIKIRSYNPARQGNMKQISKAVKMLQEASQPMIYVGGGVIQGNATKELRALMQRLQFPVTQTLMGLGAFPGTSQQNLGMLGMHGTYQANMAMHNSDLIFAVGARFDDRVTNAPAKFCPNAKVIHVDVDPTSISKIIVADVPIVGPAASVLQKMIELLDNQNEPANRPINQEALQAWWQRINQWRAEHDLRQNFDQTDDQPILPQQAIQSLYQATQGQAFVVSDVGQHQMFAAQYYKFDQPRRWINSGGLGTMGFGLPAAMGVAFASPEVPIAVVTGEGSIQMNIQELSTCTQYGLPVKIINLNNRALGMIRQWQDLSYSSRYSHSTYDGSLPDFVALAESYGHVGLKVSKLSELDATMKKAFSSELANRTVFVDILIDQDEHVYPMAVKGGGMDEMLLSKGRRT